MTPCNRPPLLPSSPNRVLRTARQIRFTTTTMQKQRGTCDNNDNQTKSRTTRRDGRPYDEKTGTCRTSNRRNKTPLKKHSSQFLKYSLSLFIEPPPRSTTALLCCVCIHVTPLIRLRPLAFTGRFRRRKHTQRIDFAWNKKARTTYGRQGDESSRLFAYVHTHIYAQQKSSAEAA